MVLVRGTVPDTRPGEQPQDLGLIDETGDYTVSVALTDDVADNGRSTVEVLRRE